MNKKRYWFKPYDLKMLIDVEKYLRETAFLSSKNAEDSKADWYYSMIAFYNKDIRSMRKELITIRRNQRNYMPWGA